LISDASNPRSIVFQLDLINAHIQKISDLPGEGVLPEQGQAEDLLAFVVQADLHAMSERTSKGRRNKLKTLLDTIIERVEELSLLVTQRYLAHVPPARPFDPWMVGDAVSEGVAP
jgi:uncharacterized alpha-E superfamily protein